LIGRSGPLPLASEPPRQTDAGGGVEQFVAAIAHQGLGDEDAEHGFTVA
jgi:hypothetical protein